MSMYMNRGPSTGKSNEKLRWWTAFLLSGSLLAAAGLSSASTTPSGILSAGTHDIFYRGEAISDEGMENLRGGFNLGGMELNFGAKLTTMINDRVRYITQVAFDNAGARVMSSTLEKTLSGADGVTRIQPSQGGNTGSGGSTSPTGTGSGASHGGIPGSTGGTGGVGNSGSGGNMSIPGNSISAAEISGQLDLSGLSDFSGVLLNDPDGGMTAALHRITRNAIVSSLSTTASGQSISNEIDVSVHVMNIGEVRASRQRDMILNSLQGIPR